MKTITTYVVVFVGAGVGGALRYSINRAALTYGSSFPWWSTLFVNVSGCLLMGLFAGWLAFRGDAGQTLRLFVLTGVLGGYTTFSAFSLDVALLWDRGEPLTAAAYVVASVALCLLAVFSGLAMMRP